MKKHLSLIIGIGLPVLVLIIAVAGIYIPSLFVNPQYSFIYTDIDRASYGGYGTWYETSGNSIVQKVVPCVPQINVRYCDKASEQTAKLFIYDVTSKTSREITLADVEGLDLDTNLKSPDGFVVEYSYRNNGIFEIFGGSNSNYSGLFIKKGSVNIPVDLTSSFTNRFGEFKFLAWIIK